jgi:AraC-like DNA-binding protein
MSTIANAKFNTAFQPPPQELFIPKGHVIALSTETQEVFDQMAQRGSFLSYVSQGRNETGQTALAYEFAEEAVGGYRRPTLLGLRTPTKAFCARRPDVDAPDALMILFANRGGVLYIGREGEQEIRPGGIVVARGQDMKNFSMIAGSEGGRVILTAGDIAAALRALGISDASAIPVFNGVAPASVAMAIHLSIQRTVAMVNKAYSKRAVEYAWRQMREYIALSILVEHPHSMTEIVVRGQQAQASPRQVRRAFEFMEQFADHDISLGDIAVAAQCSPRNLSRLFRDVAGTTPMNYLRDLRLDKARVQIVNQPEQPLGDIAVKWGFCHSGQFAQHYRRKFGETPSQTRLRY